MRFGLAAWGLRETPLTEQLALAGRLGAPLLELGIGNAPSDLLRPDSGDAAIRVAAAGFAVAGMSIECAATGNDFTLADPAACLAAAADAERCLAVAGRLGVRYLRVFAGFIAPEELTARRRELLCQCLETTVAAARAAGVVPALETHGGVRPLGVGVLHTPSVATDPAILEMLLDRFPSLFLCFDPANLDAVGSDPARFYRNYRERIATAHLKDFRRNPDGSLTPAACGDGGLDWESLRAEFSGFAGPARIEDELPGDVADGMRRSLDFLAAQRRENVA